jgi:hypothetical protein
MEYVRLENYATALALEQDELAMLRPLVAKQLKVELPKYEKVKDLFETGEANDAQIDKMNELRDKVEFFELFLKITGK